MSFHKQFDIFLGVRRYWRSVDVCSFLRSLDPFFEAVPSPEDISKDFFVPRPRKERKRSRSEKMSCPVVSVVFYLPAESSPNDLLVATARTHTRYMYLRATANPVNCYPVLGESSLEKQ